MVDPISIAAKILGVIKTLFGFKDTLAKSKLARKKRMSELFGEVAVCLEETAKSIRDGVYPAGRCQELLIYSVELPSVVDEEIGAEKAAALGETLKTAHQIEQLFAGKSTPEGQAEVAKLEEAAGLLRAMSKLVKV